MYILGINAYHADASACLIKDGEIVAACEEERFTRIKHCAGFPQNAIFSCINQSKITLDDIEYVAISKNPKRRILNKIFYSLFHLTLSSNFIKSRSKNYLKLLHIKNKFNGKKVYFIDHHQAHAASAFFVSPFDKAVILTLDGFGDFLSCMIGYGEGNKIKVISSITFPHSLGILYIAISQYLGFNKFGDEGKVMALAGYGMPTYVDVFNEIIKYHDGKYKLNLSYFLHHKNGVEEEWEKEPSYGKLYSHKLIETLGNERKHNEEINQRHKDIAASLQFVLENVVINLLNKLYKTIKVKNLCVSGGVFLNCVMNGKILSSTPFEKIFIQPASSDAGTSIGAAYYLYYQILNYPRKFIMNNVYFGPSYSSYDVENAIKKCHLKYKKENEITKVAAKLIEQGKIIGFFQGRMEFGPRALGNRSILADPRRREIKEILNARIKNRESFRPFAPSCLKENASEYFMGCESSPFMIINYKVRKEKMDIIPAVVHVDGTSRVQTVEKDINPKFYELIHNFYKLTGVPILLNTSFNENEPIVCTPEDAISCFIKTKMDYLIMEDFLIEKL
jgi:carbamoyltransferase